MPIVHTISPSDTVTAYFWEIEEAEQQLRNNLKLSAAEEYLLQQKKQLADRRSFLAVRALLKAIGCVGEVLYDTTGAPSLSTGEHISISHTHQYVSVAVSKKHTVGIDVEAFRPKIQRIAPRFLHISEAYANSISLMTQVWIAKEAVYKALRQPGIHFAEQIHISSFNGTAAAAEATVHLNSGQQQFSLTFIILNEHCATLAVPK